MRTFYGLLTSLLALSGQTTFCPCDNHIAQCIGGGLAACQGRYNVECFDVRESKLSPPPYANLNTCGCGVICEEEA